MVNRLLDRYYPLTAEGVRFRSGTKPFYDWLISSATRMGTVLNIGAGPTPPPERCLRGKFARLVGVDPDPIVLSNTDLDEAYVNDGITLPFPDSYFDAAYSDWTLEHVEHPLQFLREIARTLKPGASFWARTTNRHHYMTEVSAHTPHWFHRMTANRVRRLRMNAHDPWPTRYRVNTQASLRELICRAGFASVDVRTLEPEPVYLQFNPAAFILGVAYERLVNRYRALAEFRLIIMCRATK